MIDDHDKCEWVNVSSGTSSPELSWTKSRELWNGCVCVFVCVCVRARVLSEQFLIIQFVHKKGIPLIILRYQLQTFNGLNKMLYPQSSACFWSLFSILDFNEARYDRVAVASGEPCADHLHFARDR